MCSLYNVSRAGYYAWKKRGVSKRHLNDMSLLKEIRLIYEKSRRTYGSPRIFRELRSKDIRMGALIGMGATILDDAVIGDECLVGAGTLVTEGKKFPPRSLILGSPGKVVRTLSDSDIDNILKNAADYVLKAKEYKKLLP